MESLILMNRRVRKVEMYIVVAMLVEVLAAEDLELCASLAKKKVLLARE